MGEISCFAPWARYWGQVNHIAFEKDNVRGGGQRRPAETKRKNRVFSAKYQAVWFEM